MPDQVGKNASHKGTDQFIKKGQTSGAYGNNPSVKAKGAAGTPPTELNP